MTNLNGLIAEANADLAEIGPARLVAFDAFHIYVFKDGFEELSRSGPPKARLVSYIELKALYNFYGKKRRPKSVDYR